MVVLFFRDEEGVVKCLDIAVDQVHDLVGMMQAEGCVPTTAQLTAMTKKQLRELLSGLGLHMTNFDKATKATVAQNIVDNWSRLQTRASGVASSSAPSTGQGYNVVEDNAPKFKHGGLPSGYGLLIDKIDPTTKGFQVFYMQGKLHITTDFGCRQVCDDDEEEETEREWMMKHNFVLLGRKDWMEDNGLDELTPRTSDPSESTDEDSVAKGAFMLTWTVYDTRDGGEVCLGVAQLIIYPDRSISTMNVKSVELIKKIRMVSDFDFKVLCFHNGVPLTNQVMSLNYYNIKDGDEIDVKLYGIDDPRFGDFFDGSDAPHQKEEEEVKWTSDDEARLTLLKSLQRPGMAVNPDQLQDLETKKQKYEKMTKTGAETDYDIEDYINLQDAPYFLTDEYLRDPSCFDDADVPHDKTFVPLKITIKEPYGRDLFVIVVPSDKYVGCLKTFIVDKVATLSSAKHRLMEENFGLYVDTWGFTMSPLSTTDKLEDIADGKKEFTLYLVLKLQGGGGLGVRRTIKKTKPTTASDATSYSHVFDVAKIITENSTCDLGNLLGDMDASALTDLRKYISTDKAHLQKKVANVASYTPQFKQIQAVIDKLEYAKEKLVDLTAECVNEQCMNDDEPLKAVLLSKIDVAIGKKQSADASAMDADL